MDRRTVNNKSGIAMVSIIIVVALLTIMAATVLQLSYLSYTRKMVERRSNETYYTAESCIDTIKAAVQNKVATQLKNASKGTAEFINSSAAVLSDTALGMSLEQWLYNQIVFKNGVAVSVDPTTVNTNTNLKNDADYYNGYKAGEFTTIWEGLGGDSWKSKKTFEVGMIHTEEDKLSFHVNIIFTNKQGYTSEISTDIVVNAPAYAKVSDAPVSSYSMFAGAGAYITGSDAFNSNSSGTMIHNMVFVHQEGNVYFGKGTFDKYNGSLGYEGSLVLDPNGAGGVEFSVGGTNCIFNGDVFVTNGSTLCFTGGDGTKDAKVRVNGIIYLNNGATLLLAPNVRLECQGIYVNNTDAKYPAKSSYIEYTGAGSLESTLSPYYPAKKDYISSTSAYTDYKKTGTKKVLYDCLVEAGDKFQNVRSKYDDRFLNVGSNESKHTCGVYILNSDHSTSGWSHKDTDAYYLVTKNAGAYKTPGKATLYNSNIYADPLDIEYSTKDRVNYGTTQVDYEFAAIMNIPVLDIWNFDTQKKLGQSVIAGYKNTGDDAVDTYSMTYYKDLKSYLTGKNVLSDVVNSFGWADIEDGLSNNSGTQVIPQTKRGLRTPDKDTFTWDSCSLPSIQADDGTLYTTGQLNVGLTNGKNSVVNCNSTSYYISFCENEIELHIGAGKSYVGLFLSGESLWVGGSSGMTKGTSMLELANRTMTTPGIQNVGNPVREMLSTLGASPVYPVTNLDNIKGHNVGNVSGNIAYSSLALFDNMLAEGVKCFWTDTESDGGDKNGADNSNTNLVEVDNYQKN